MKSYAYLWALMAAAAGIPYGGGGVQPTNLVEVSAQAKAGKASPARPSQEQRSNAAKLAKQSVGRYSRSKPWAYGSGGWTVAEGKRRARKARNRSRHKRACGRRS